MYIEKIIAAKQELERELEQTISQKLKAFENANGVPISSIYTSVIMAEMIGSRKPVFRGVRVECKIEF